MKDLQRAARSARHAPAHTVFFVLACVQAAVAVPLWTAEYLGWLDSCAACAPSLRHGHEMLLGYAVAVIGGFLFTRLTWPTLALTATAWLAGRAVAAFELQGWVAAAIAMLYPAILMVLAGAPFIKAAKTGRNLVFAPLLSGFLLAEALYQAGHLGLLAAGERRGVLLAVDLVAAMVLVMGGRIIPAAMAGLVRARGDTMNERNAPNLERITIAGMAFAALCHGFDLGWGVLGWGVAGAAGLARLARWRFGAALSVPSMWPLQVGYGLLAGGLAAAALAGLADRGWATAVLHAATVGGLGIVTSVMMVRTVMLRGRISAGFPRPALAAVALLLAATGTRVGAPLAAEALLPASALAWAAAFLATGVALVGLTRTAKESQS